MIYLDHAATTPVPRAVADAMYAVLTEQFANPSAQYPMGLEMKKQLAAWRRTIAGALGCDTRRCSSPPAEPRATTGPSGPLCGKTAIWAATSSPPPWSTAPCWRPAAGPSRTAAR